MAKRKISGTPEYEFFKELAQFDVDCGNPEDTEEYWYKVQSWVIKVNGDKRYEGYKDFVYELSFAIQRVLEHRRDSIREFGDDKHGFEMMERKKEQLEKYKVKKMRVLAEGTAQDC